MLDFSYFLNIAYYILANSVWESDISGIVLAVISQLLGQK